MIKLKRAYEKAEKADGTRILVDRLWPRGVSRAKIRIKSWEKEIAPSAELREWFGHDPKRWIAFKRKYRAELRKNKAAVSALRARAKGRTVTLVYAARDAAHNNAVVLKEALAR
jgi:uncharacterized protein YeaO (DUF488 family)